MFSGGGCSAALTIRSFPPGCPRPLAAVCGAPTAALVRPSRCNPRPASPTPLLPATHSPAPLLLSPCLSPALLYADLSLPATCIRPFSATWAQRELWRRLPPGALGPLSMGTASAGVTCRIAYTALTQAERPTPALQPAASPCLEIHPCPAGSCCPRPVAPLAPMQAGGLSFFTTAAENPTIVACAAVAWDVWVNGRRRRCFGAHTHTHTHTHLRDYLPPPCTCYQPFVGSYLPHLFL